ncbi:hypothetical protein ES703_53243 [subsurface metagenome]
MNNETLREIKKRIEHIDLEKKRLVEQLSKREAKIEETPWLACSKCGDRHEIWGVKADFNPEKLMAFQSRSLWLVCGKCDHTVEIPVRSHMG